MTTKDPEQTASTNSSEHPRGSCRVPSRKARLTLGAVALLLTGAMIGGAITLAAGASAHGRSGSDAHSGDGAGRMARHVQRKLRRVLAEVDATDAQAEQAQDIVDAFVADVQPLKAEHRDQRKAFLAAVLAEEIDVAQVETLRSEAIETADRLSRELSEGLTALAQVFDPEQRAAIAEMAERFGGRHGRHRHR